MRGLLPNIEFAPQASEPPADDLPVPGLALVALRSVANEELFLNYRLNPNLPSLPDWYVPVDADEDARRWS